MEHRIDPQGQRLPIKVDTTSNGEFVPVAELSRACRDHRAQEAASANAKRLGMGRRDFLLSTGGAAKPSTPHRRCAASPMRVPQAHLGFLVRSSRLCGNCIPGGTVSS